MSVVEGDPVEGPSAAYLVGLLARAMTTQIDELAVAAPTPDGWWFTEPEREAGDPR